MEFTHLLDAGYALVPVPLKAKGPTCTDWNLPHNAITAPSQASRLRGMNVGLAHAYCKPEPTCAIDVDQYLAAKEWLKHQGIDLEGLLLQEGAVAIWSGKEHSIKLLYRLQAGVPPLPTKKFSDEGKRTILEFRCASRSGLTVQDLLPPSVHPRGTAYQWLGSGSPLNLPTIPEPLFDLWSRLIARRKRTTTQRHSALMETPRTVAQVEQMLKWISADCDYETWRNVIWAVLSTGWKSAEDIALNWSKSAPDRYEHDAFWLVVNSYEPDRESGPTLGTIYYLARAGGWHE